MGNVLNRTRVPLFTSIRVTRSDMTVGIVVGAGVASARRDRLDAASAMIASPAIRAISRQVACMRVAKANIF